MVVAVVVAMAVAVVAAEEEVVVAAEDAEGNHAYQKAPAHREVLPHSTLPVAVIPTRKL